jgi:hypothetical protein
MDIPISLLSEFTNYADTKEMVAQRFIQLLKQYLYDETIVRNQADLNQKILACYEQPIEFRKTLRNNIDDQLVYARIYFVFCFLLHEKSEEVNIAFQEMVGYIYTKLDFYNKEKHAGVLLCYDIETKKIVNYLSS